MQDLNGNCPVVKDTRGHTYGFATMAWSLLSADADQRTPTLCVSLDTSQYTQYTVRHNTMPLLTRTEDRWESQILLTVSFFQVVKNILKDYVRKLAGKFYWALLLFIFCILYSYLLFCIFVVVYLCYFVQYALDFYVIDTVCVFQKRSLCIWSLVVLLYIFTTFLYFMGSCPPQFLVNIGVSLITNTNTNTNTTASGSIHNLMKKNNCIRGRLRVQ